MAQASAHRAIAAVLFALLATGAGAQTQPLLTGDTDLHDPSVIFHDGMFVSFATGGENSSDGGTPRVKTSPDGLAWDDAGSIPGGVPAWITKELGYDPSNIWAPSVTLHGGVAYMYYSASTFGSQESLIALMINPAFDPRNPTAGWEDRGMVIRSVKGDGFNAIDPFRFDDFSGSWLVFGSYWDGIRLIPLDPVSGLRLGEEAPVALASRQGKAIEAPAIMKRGEWYYLFTSFDRCCRGTGSTYRIMVGRSADIKGPYADRDGTPLLENGGTEVLKGEGARRGPGGQETFMVGDEYWLAWHYYDRKMYGLSKLQIARLHFDGEGWPLLDPPPAE